MSDINTKEKTIRELRTKLNKSQDQVEALEKAMESLIKSHSEELSRLAAEKEKLTAWTLHTPSGSPRIQPKNDIHQSEEEEDWTVPSSSSTIQKQDDLDDQLMTLTKQKEKVILIRIYYFIKLLILLF